MTDDQEQTLRALGYCSCCRRALNKSKGLAFAGMNRRASWEYPTRGDELLKLPWREAVGVLCDDCASAGSRPTWAVELRGDTVFYYTPVELQEAFVPSEELLSFCRSNGLRFHWSKAPRQVADAVRAFMKGEELPESAVSVVRWYAWQSCQGKDAPPDLREKLLGLDQRELNVFLSEELPKKHGIEVL
ncbi:MAG: hypothetical protein JRN39_04185 [Nitrososphaerota archaeon]|nr:hypothetical protein [Nitrososphaerota archaeon]MDG6939583.1 hypothetical protein [Nitrososphaerota archaeon]